MSKRSQPNKATGFTLVEILVVLAIIAILAAILFPAFNRARESGRQSHCQANMQKIYFAVRQYYDDEKYYPGSLAVLLPNTSNLIHYAGNTSIPNLNGSGYLHVSDKAFMCLDDPGASDFPRSSYGDISDNWADLSSGPASSGPTGDPGRWVWNYWGYQPNGISYPNQAAAMSAATATPALLTDPTSGYGLRNGIKYSLSNRNAPSSTIITHCVYHRPLTAANITDPGTLYTTPANDTYAQDIVLRLDGSSKPVDVSKFPTADQWRAQNVTTTP